MLTELRRLTLTRPGLLRLLDRLDDQPDGETRYLPTGATPPALPADAAALLERASEAPTGAVLFFGESVCLAVLPPFPLEQARAERGYHTMPLRELLTRERTLG